VVGEAADGAQAVALARAARPEVVLMDIRMPHLDGLQPTRQLATMAGLERVRVLILPTYDSHAQVFQALAGGASGWCWPRSVRGLSNAEIAERLVPSKVTARTRVSRAIGKLGARDRAQLVVVACQTGLVDPHPPDRGVAAAPSPIAPSSARQEAGRRSR
jgi:DNA-binding NarL/FixJ family response regulator